MEPDTATPDEPVPRPAAHPGGESPYGGLAPFGQDRGDVYFGRERLVDDLRWRVVARTLSGGILIVTGASGAGKSSLLRAGLLASITERRFPIAGATAWPRLVMTPGPNPMATLAAELAEPARSDPETVLGALKTSPRTAHALVNDLLPAARGDDPMRLLLVVDQFEELFTLADAADRRPFIETLHAIADEGPDGVPGIVVLGLRGDFHDRCTAYRELIPPLQNNLVVGPMSADEARRAVTAPADAAGLTLEPGLADEVLEQRRAAEESGAPALPLLSQTMHLLWRKRTGDRLTRRALASFGGVERAVEAAAEEAYRALDPDQRTAAADLFRRLTFVTAEGNLARRPLPHRDVEEAVGPVLERFAAARLIVRTATASEIAHETLLHRWPRLRDWTARP